MIFSFGKTSLPPTIKPKDDFSYYQQLEKNLVNRFNLTNEQFESLFFENGKIGETKQGPFTLCHWDSMIDTIKETPYFSTLIRLNIKENKPGAERQVRFPMNINGKRYKITKHDLLNRENLEKEEAKRCQKGRQNSEGLTGFKLLLIAYLKDQNILNQEGNLHNIYQINVGRYSHFNMNTFFGENYITNQANIDDLSTLYNEVITIDINTNNTAQTTKVGPFSVILAPMGFHVQGVDDITKSKNIVIENNGNYYLPKDGIQGNIKTCLFDSHAYAYKNIYTNDNGEKIIVLENPRDTKEKLHIPLKDIKEFCMFRKNQIDITRLLEDILKSHISSISNKAKEELNQNLSSNSL